MSEESELQREVKKLRGQLKALEDTQRLRIAVQAKDKDGVLKTKALVTQLRAKNKATNKELSSEKRQNKTVNNALTERISALEDELALKTKIELINIQSKPTDIMERDLSNINDDIQRLMDGSKKHANTMKKMKTTLDEFKHSFNNYLLNKDI